jgi:hypothetical protein
MSIEEYNSAMAEREALYFYLNYLKKPDKDNQYANRIQQLNAWISKDSGNVQKYQPLEDIAFTVSADPARKNLGLEEKANRTPKDTRTYTQQNFYSLGLGGKPPPMDVELIQDNQYQRKQQTFQEIQQNPNYSAAVALRNRLFYVINNPNDLEIFIGDDTKKLAKSVIDDLHRAIIQFETVTAQDNTKVTSEAAKLNSACQTILKKYHRPLLVDQNFFNTIRSWWNELFKKCSMPKFFYYDKIDDTPLARDSRLMDSIENLENQSIKPGSMRR